MIIIYGAEGSKMIFRNIEFHNVAELEAIPGMGGWRLQRFPEKVRNCLGHKEHERGRFYSQKSVGCEIRFATDAKFVRVSLSAIEQDGTVLVYKGDFFHSFHTLKAGVVTTLHLENPPKFSSVKAECLKGRLFSPNIWRLQFGKDTGISFHHIDSFGHELRPPKEDEMPKLTWLAYGSSITFGGDVLLYSNAYIEQAARRLKVNVLNKGIAGSCFCDEAIANYIADCKEWDFVTLELGVNMRGRFTPEEYEKRVRYLLKKIVEKRPGKPIVAIGIYPNGSLYSLDEENPITRDNLVFDELLKRIVREMDSKYIYYIDGKDILTDFSGLSSDLLHPSDYGHIIMGENLSRILKKLLGDIFPSLI